ncbi:HEAT repeat domain-containing protein [candidate division KSB1 bacterium]|nr:HEAT repeat domain-containing protein [candidate division KSB1 bacterium]
MMKLLCSGLFRLLVPTIFILFSSRLQAEENFILNEKTRNYDQLHLKLKLAFDFRHASVSGTEWLQFKPCADRFDELRLHSQSTKIKSIRLEGKSLSHRHSGDVLFIKLDRKYKKNQVLEIEINYAAKPVDGLYFFSPTTENPEIPFQIWSQGQGYRNHHWFPCYDLSDDRFTSEIIASVPDSMMVISNGTLIDVKENTKTRQKTFHYKIDHEHVSYLISIVVGDFVRINDSIRGIDVNYFVPKKEVDAGIRAFARTPEMIDILSDYFVPYPFEKYDQTPVWDFLYGGMENITATTLNRRCLHTGAAQPNYSPDYLISHELAHQWFGNLITCRSGHHSWLNEGFATYGTDIFIEKFHGNDAFQIARLENDRSYFESLESFPLADSKPCTETGIPVEMEGRKAYYRGSAILHMLRFVLGDARFQHAMRYYLEKYQYQSIVTEQFVSAIEESLDEDLSWFFDQWIYGGGFPVFEINWQWDASRKQTVLHVNQVQEKLPVVGIFKMPVIIEITSGKEKIIRKGWLTKEAQQFRFHCPEKPSMVRFDKGYHLLKQLIFRKSFDEWAYQLMADSDPTGRIFAAETLAVFGEQAIPVLERSFRTESEVAVRKTVIASLGKIGGDDSFRLNLLALRDADARVRVEAANNLANFPSETVSNLLIEIIDGEKNDYVRAAATEALGRVKAPGAFQILEKLLSVDSHRNIIRRGALKGLAALNTPAALPLAKEYVKYKHSYGGMHLLENEALTLALQFSDTHRDSVMVILETALKNPYHRFRSRVAQTLADMNAVELLPALIEIRKTERRQIVIPSLDYAIHKLSHLNSKTQRYPALVE